MSILKVEDESYVFSRSFLTRVGLLLFLDLLEDLVLKKFFGSNNFNVSYLRFLIIRGYFYLLYFQKRKKWTPSRLFPLSKIF